MRQSHIDRLNQLALENVRNGGKPYSALIVLEDKIIASGVNESHLYSDATLHAELLAIQRASQILSPSELAKCVLIASGQPCLMCYTGAQYARIQEIYFIMSKEEIMTHSKNYPALPDIPMSQVGDDSIVTIFKNWIKNTP